MNRVLVFALALSVAGCSGALVAQPVSPPGDVVARYVAVDVAAFARPAEAADSDLYRGLRALVYGDADEAERALGSAARVVPDSLRPFVYGRLESLAARRFDWQGALRYAALQAEARGDAFDPATSKWTVFRARPAPSATVLAGSTTVPFDGYRADGAVFGPGGGTNVRFFLDSGSPVTLLSRTLADRLGLALDSSAGGAVSIPARGINGAAVLRTVLDSVRIGSAVLRNVPADVLDTDRPVADGADLFLGFDALSGLLGGIRYGFADSTLTLYEAGRTPGRGAAPNLVLEAGYAFLAFEADGQPFTGVVDTGSPFSYVYAASWTPPDGATGRPVTHRGRLADTEYEFTLNYYDFRARFAGADIDTLPLGLSTRGPVGAPFRVMSLLGTGLFADGALVLDFDRRVATYER